MGILAIDAAAALLNVSEIQQERLAKLQPYGVFKERLSSEDENEFENQLFDTVLSSGKSGGVLNMINFLPDEIYNFFDNCKVSLKKI